MRPVARPLLALLFFGVAASVPAAGCAAGDEQSYVDLPSGTDGGTSRPQSPPPPAADASGLLLGDASSVVPGEDASSFAPGDDASTSAPDDATLTDAPAATDAPPPVDGAPHVDAAPPIDADRPDANDAGSMSPVLSLPPPGSTPCTFVGEDVDCPEGDTCLIATPTAGACVSCVACNGYQHPCTKDSDCMSPYQCYANVCSYICRVGHNDDCDFKQTCVDVGSAKYGVCAS